MRSHGNSRRRDCKGARGAAGRYFQWLFGTSKAWNLGAVLIRGINEGDCGPLEEMRRASRHAVRKILGYVPEGADWAGYNAFSDTGDTPLSAIVLLFQHGEGPEEIEERIRQQAKKK